MDLKRYTQLEYQLGTPRAQQSVLEILETCKTNPDFDGPLVANVLDQIFDIQWESWDTLEPAAILEIERFIDVFWSVEEFGNFLVCSS